MVQAQGAYPGIDMADSMGARARLLTAVCLPFMLEHAVDQRVAPAVADQHGIAQPAFILHADLFHDVCRGYVAWIAGGKDVVLG